MLTICPLSQAQDPSPELVADERDPYFGSIQWRLEDQSPVERKGQIADAPEGPALLRVYTKKPGVENNGDTDPAVLGKYLWEGDRLIFQPRFPFLSGRSYWLWSHTRSSRAKILEIKIPVIRPLTPPKVAAVFPTSDTWPANQLKCYIYFDQPMRAGQASEALQLYDDSGKKVEVPFLEMGRELWDPELKRLTIWFDPGRIKSLLIPNQRMGPPLQPNRTYRLVVKSSWQAANGLTLEEDYVKNFLTGHRDSHRPDPEDWTFTLPASGTLDPLQITFPEPMDAALLFSGFGMLTREKEVLTGRIEIGEKEKSWYWFPDRTWEKTSYILRISTDVEDLAGNNLVRLFDSPVDTESTQGRQATYIDRELVIQ